MFNTIKNDPVLKGITIVVLLIVAFGLIYYLFGGLLGFGGGYGMMNTYGYGLGLSGIIAGLLKLLLVISIVGLIVGLAVYIYQNYLKESVKKATSAEIDQKSLTACPKCGVKASAEFKFCPSCGEKIKQECVSCKAELRSEWKCCPVCGTEKELE